MAMSESAITNDSDNADGRHSDSHLDVCLWWHWTKRIALWDTLFAWSVSVRRRQRRSRPPLSMNRQSTLQINLQLQCVVFSASPQRSFILSCLLFLLLQLASNAYSIHWGGWVLHLGKLWLKKRILTLLI